MLAGASPAREVGILVVRIVERVLRAPIEEFPVIQRRLDTPPEQLRSSRGERAMTIGMLVPALGSLLMVFSPGAGSTARLVGILIGASSAGLVLVRLFAGQAHGDRQTYLAYLRRVADETAFQIDRELELLDSMHPAPAALVGHVAEERRVWERRSGDADFAVGRLGHTQCPPACRLLPPATTRLDELDQPCVEAMSRLLDTYRTVDGVPLTFDLRAHPSLTVVGHGEARRSLIRAFIAGVAVFHGPDDLAICIGTSPEGLRHWQWAKWLPHTRHPTMRDEAGPARMIATDEAALEYLLHKQLKDRPVFQQGSTESNGAHLLVILDGLTAKAQSPLARPGGIRGVTVLDLAAEPPKHSSGYPYLRVDGQTMHLRIGYETTEAIADKLTLSEATALARQLAPLRIGGGADGDEPLLSALDFTDLMGIGDPGSFDTRRGWKRLSPQDRLRVPIGVGENGEPVVLDIKEAAMGGMGPHGLCIGATGSGKSEVLRTLVLALAVTHSSENLNFVLSDFKGGATFAGMAQMPHTAAVITNLADDLTMVDRMRDAIVGEMNRRQEMLRDGGNFKNIHDYEKARSAGAALTPMPNLMIVLDEFSEMLTAKPEFLDLFIQIGRIGRSLGVHLLLASQRLEEGKLRGLDTYLSYRLGLKTFSAAESRVVLGVPDAFTLPSLPGSGYLKTVGADQGNPAGARFKAAYVSGPYRPATRTTVARTLDYRRPTVFTSLYQAPARVDEPTAAVPIAADDDALSDTVLDVLVRQMEGQGPAAHQVWLPPLAEPPTLDQLMPGLQATGPRGLTATAYSGAGRLLVPIGIADKPIEQKRELYQLDLSSAAGHAVVVGGPQTGKSTMVRTILMGLALGHTPAEVQFFALDFGGGSLSRLAGLPHTSGIGGRLDGDVVRRVISEVVAILDRREQSFRRHGIDSIGTFRARRARGELPDEPFGDVFLVVDGWATLRADYELLEQDIFEIAQRGLGFGVHVIITAGRWPEIRPQLKDAINTRIELRLGDPMESDIDRRVAVNVPTGTPGRGLTRDKLHFLAALPRIDGIEDATNLADGAAKAVHAIADAWQGPPAPKLRMLPLMVPYTDLPTAAQRPGQVVPLGVDETRLEPVYLDFNADPHFLLFGEGESGKTSVLRTLIQGITEAYTPAQARILVVDYRRTLLEVVPSTHLLRHCSSSIVATQVVGEVHSALQKRQPGQDVSTEQLRRRSWWTGPEIFVIVDDYDLVATSSNPLLPLAEYLLMARDLGLHLIVARASGGANRALFEPLVQRLRETRQPGLMLSGGREEGQLIGQVRPTTLPPGRGTMVSRNHGTILIQAAYCSERSRTVLS